MQDVAELIDHLFKTYRHPSGREYTYAEVSRALNEELDPTTIGKLRQGSIKNPGRNALLLLCMFFQVPASYFFPELEPPTESDDAPRSLDAEITRKAADLSPESKRALLAFLDSLRRGSK